MNSMFLINKKNQNKDRNFSQYCNACLGVITGGGGERENGFMSFIIYLDHEMKLNYSCYYSINYYHNNFFSNTFQALNIFMWISFFFFSTQSDCTGEIARRDIFSEIHFIKMCELTYII